MVGHRGDRRYSERLVHRVRDLDDGFVRHGNLRSSVDVPGRHGLGNRGQLRPADLRRQRQRVPQAGRESLQRLERHDDRADQVAPTNDHARREEFRLVAYQHDVDVVERTAPDDPAYRGAVECDLHLERPAKGTPASNSFFGANGPWNHPALVIVSFFDGHTASLPDTVDVSATGANYLPGP